MNYLHVLFQKGIQMRAEVTEAANLASFALLVGMIAIWAQVIATL